MTADIRLRPEAEQDLVEAAVWYEQQQTGLGRRFLDEALATLSMIAEMPLAHGIVHRSTRRVMIHRFPFCVFYQIDVDGVVVIGVLHGSRDPRSWKGRV